ncbi:MAG: type II toxin-antitoxin system RelE/ParE family toxin, partial [Janthinobacterium lividum]
MRPPVRHSGRPAPQQPDRPQLRPLVWMGSSRSDISEMPQEVKGSFGFRLSELQQGGTPLDMKPLPQFGGGVFELRDS